MRNEPKNLKSPFLDEEIHPASEPDEAWQPRLARLVNESPFGHAFEHNRSASIEPEELEEESPDEESYSAQFDNAAEEASVFGSVDEIEGLAIESEIIGPNDMTRVENSLAVPYRWICRLDIEYEIRGFGGSSIMKGHGRATGVLIGARHILTAAHNIKQYDSKARNYLWAKSIKVSLAHNGSETPPGASIEADLSKSHVHPLYDVTKRVDAKGFPIPAGEFETNQYDYALLTLKTPIEESLGYWGAKGSGGSAQFRYLDPKSLDKSRILVAGYGSDECVKAVRLARRDKNIPLGSQLEASGKLSIQWLIQGDITCALKGMLHNADTCKVQSGSPIWLKHNNVFELVGIHTAAVILCNGNSMNYAVRVTQEMMLQVGKWQSASSRSSKVVHENITNDQDIIFTELCFDEIEEEEFEDNVKTYDEALAYEDNEELEYSDRGDELEVDAEETTSSEAFEELWSEEDPSPKVTPGRNADEIRVTREDGTLYVVRRKVRAHLLTRSGGARVGFCSDDERVFFRLAWCEGTQGTIDVGANVPAALKSLISTVVGQINRGASPEEIKQTFENTQVQPFVKLDITRIGSWKFTGDLTLDINHNSIISTTAKVSANMGWGKVGVAYEDDGTGKQVRVTFDVPLGNRTVQGKKNCPVHELAIWWDAECLREVQRTDTLRPLRITKSDTLYLYFEQAKRILRRDPKARTESAGVVNEILKSDPKLGTALLNKRTLELLDYRVGQGYWLESVKGYTSPEGRRGPPRRRDGGASAKWEGNTELARERAKKVRDLIESRYVHSSLQMRNPPPRMRFPAGKSLPTGVGLSEKPELDKQSGVELEGAALDRRMIHGDKKADDPRPFLEQCPLELGLMTDDDRKYVTDARMSDRKRAERLFENLRRVEIHLQHYEALDSSVTYTDLEHEHNCPPDVIEAARQKWGSGIPFTKPDPPHCD